MMVMESHPNTSHFSKDVDPVAEKMLTLTLEIICLLTGEDYMIVRKPGDHVAYESDGPPGTRSSSPGPPPHSLTHERNREQKILELTNKMMSLLTGEVPVRCDDVTVYFSMEEWEYLEGHKELYRDVMMETHQPRGSPDASEVRDRAPNSTLDCKTSHFINEDRSPSDGNVSAAEHDGGDNTSVHIKEESASNEDYWIPTEHKGSTSTDKTQTSNTHFQCETPPDEGTYSCPECQERFTSDSDLLLHQTIHNRSAVSSLDCGKSFTSKSELLLRHQIQTWLKPFSCAECGKSFSRNAHLVRHFRIHTGEKPFSCAECGKCFNRNTHLVQHFRIHTKEKPYSCPNCEKHFNRNCHLARHLKSHIREKPCSCSECGKSFNNKSYLTQHLRVHSREKPHSCSQCGKSFNRKSHLVRHVSIHTGEKPYSCSQCGKCFNRNSNLLQHLKLHTGVKPYECAACGKCFAKKSNLVSHQRTHTG